MHRPVRLLALSLVWAISASTAIDERPAVAQSGFGFQVDRGFETTLKPEVSGEELQSQRNFWALEVTFKPMRMIRVPVTNLETGKKENRLVWYLVYKAVRRPAPPQLSDAEPVPVNEYDEPPSQPLFVPEFTLFTEDADGQHIYSDVVLPEAQAAVLKRELRSPKDAKLKNTVEIVGPIPAITEQGALAEDVLYGVVTWTGIDPETDFFTVMMSGFSNGYRVGQGPDGESLHSRRTIVQQFWRPGDRFDENEAEFRAKGDPKWIYRPDESPAQAAPAAADDSAAPPAAADAPDAEAAPE